MISEGGESTNTYYMAGIPFSGDHLAHHGIKNQQWGIRRYQNPDGSLTPLGKRHRSIRESAMLQTELDKNKNLTTQTAPAKINTSAQSKAAASTSRSLESGWREISREEYEAAKEKYSKPAAQRIAEENLKKTVSQIISSPSTQAGKQETEKKETKKKKSSKKKTQKKAKEKKVSRITAKRGPGFKINTGSGGSGGRNVKNLIWQVGIH